MFKASEQKSQIKCLIYNQMCPRVRVTSCCPLFGMWAQIGDNRTVFSADQALSAQLRPDN